MSPAARPRNVPNVEGVALPSTRREAHDERGHDEVERLRDRVGLLVEGHLGQPVPREAGQQRRGGGDREAVVGVVEQLLLADPQHLHLELRTQRVLVGIEHRGSRCVRDESALGDGFTSRGAGDGRGHRLGW